MRLTSPRNMRATGSAHRQRPHDPCGVRARLLSGRIYAMVVRPRLAVTPLITVTQGVVLWCMIYLHADGERTTEKKCLMCASRSLVDEECQCNTRVYEKDLRRDDAKAVNRSTGRLLQHAKMQQSVPAHARSHGWHCYDHVPCSVPSGGDSGHARRVSSS